MSNGRVVRVPDTAPGGTTRPTDSPHWKEPDMTQDNSPQRQIPAFIGDKELAALRRLAETPAEYASGEHAAAQSQLASAVPVLLDEIGRTHAMIAEIRAIFAAFDWEHDDRQYALEQIEMVVEMGDE